jgi:vacuolar-type H+-ATPase subunit D/Vma8
MLLAEALASRKSALKKIGELETRIAASALSYEGEKPEDKSDDLIKEFEALVAEFEALSTRINRTNNTVSIQFFGKSYSMMEAVAMREAMLLQQRGWKRIAVAIETAQGKGRYGYGARRTKDDLKQVVHLSPAALRKSSDRFAQKLETLNVAMQQVNWTTELLD